MSLARALTLSAIAAAAVAAPLRAQTILNVERLQPGDVSGTHWGVEGSLGMAGGNDEYVDVLAGVVVGERWSRDWLRAFVGLDFRSETGKPREDERYLHVRWNHWWADRWQTFHFVQLQSSRQGLLQDRFLLGSGLRRRLLDGGTTFDVGTGAMYEREDLDASRVTDAHPAEARVWRMANLLVATRPLTESVRLIGVSYLQPDLSDFGDLRTLTDLTLLIELTDNLDLTVHGVWRHDSRPPGGRDSDDVVFETGFTITFR